MQVIFIISLFVLFLFFISAPETVFSAATESIELWSDTVVPSMLPFFILNHLLASAGGLTLIGKIFERPVRAILKLPGEAAFVLAAGYSTGVPVSAAVIADLRKKNILSRKQGEHLLAFAANVSPGFLLSALGAGMLGNVSFGVFLAAVQYGTNLGMTLLFSAFTHDNTHRSLCPIKSTPNAPLMTLLTESVEKSLKTVFLIGGIIMSFRVLIALLESSRIIPTVCGIFSLSTETAAAAQVIFRGLAEITLGAQSLSEIDNISIPLRLALLSFILGFGGISAFCQVKAELKGTDLTMGFYLRYKIIQGVTAFTVSLLLFDHVNKISPTGIAHSSPVAFDISIFPWIGGIILLGLSLLIIRRLFCE